MRRIDLSVKKPESSFLIVIASAILLCGAAWAGQTQEQQVIPIPRNFAFNHMVTSLIRAHDHISILHRFMKSHEHQVKLAVYDIETFRALDSAEQELQEAANDLRAIREQLEWKEQSAQKFRP